MTIFINDEKKVIESGTTLSQLLKVNNLSEKKGLAIALNGSVVSKTNWHNTLLNEDDKVLLISATQGG